MVDSNGQCLLDIIWIIYNILSNFVFVFVICHYFLLLVVSPRLCICEEIIPVYVFWPNMIQWRVTICYETSGNCCLKINILSNFRGHCPNLIEWCPLTQDVRIINKDSSPSSQALLWASSREPLSKRMECLGLLCIYRQSKAMTKIIWQISSQCWELVTHMAG